MKGYEAAITYYKLSTIRSFRIFKKDRKQQIGTLMFFLGIILWMTTPKYDHYLLFFESLIKSGMTVMSFVLMISGFHGIMWRILDSRRLKWLDFIWMMSTTITVIFALTNAFLIPADQMRKMEQKNIEKLRASLEMDIEIKYIELCESSNPLPKESCRALREIHEDLRTKNNIYAFQVRKICPTHL